MAQTENNIVTSNTMLLENLDLKQKAWLNDNDFPFLSYDLRHNDINLHLQEACMQGKMGGRELP